ncbi:transcriptional regulator [Actinorhabdospora filicis]|uniref:Transcriptional regulator n=1 Tax=Actinorhabdospora filicis TaxID=1785913 RepID=A0A9W6SM93_9ACTN|nr:LuxR family transcriptional regulator [Actinorhabdospora filicis]GLZ79525.1 transcriptional regulator [Actinorhabdospora filicis]
MRVFGRAAELSLVGAVLDTPREAPGALILYGEAGIGKTTLWTLAADRARARELRVLSTKTSETEARMSFTGLFDLFDGCWDDVRDGLPTPQREAMDVVLLRAHPGDTPLDPRTVGVATLSVLRRLPGPTVLAVDDAQWLDAATARALNYALRRLTKEPLLLLTTVRASEPDAGPLDLTDTRLADDRTTVHLGPLGLTELHHLVRDRAGLELSRPVLTHLHEICAGNPLFALETAERIRREPPASPAERLPAPESVGELIADRVAALPKATGEALLYAAALAHPTVRDVRDALGRHGGELFAPAEEAGLVEIREGRIAFAHPLYAAAVYDRATGEHRHTVHRRLSTVVTDEEARAWHLALAAEGFDPKLAAPLDAAARRADARAAPATAARLWELALRHTFPDDPERARRQSRQARCLFTSGDAGRARIVLEDAVPRLPAGEPRARALSELAEILFYQGSTAEAADACRAALTEAAGAPELEAVLLLRLSWFSTHDAGAQSEASAKALEIMRALPEPDPELLALVLSVAAMYRMMSGGGPSHGDVAEASGLFELTAPRTWAGAWAWTAIADWDRYFDLPRARDRFAARHRWTAERGDEQQGHMLMLLSELDCWLGDWRRARERATAALAMVEQTGQRRWCGFCLYALAMVDAHLGDDEAARKHATRGLALAESADDPYVAALHLQVLGFLDLSLGRAADAVDVFARAEALVARMGIPDPARHAFHADQVEALIATGDPARATDRLRDMESRLAAAPRPWLTVAVGRSRALLRLAAGDAVAAEAALDEVLTACETLPMPFERARTLLVKGCALRARKQKKAAREALLSAQEIFTRLGAVLWSRRTADELSRCGQRHIPPLELTPTEARIVALVADGMTNREVAATAHVSVKTVEANLSSAYRKLGVRGRIELIRRGS